MWGDSDGNINTVLLLCCIMLHPASGLIHVSLCQCQGSRFTLHWWAGEERYTICRAGSPTVQNILLPHYQSSPLASSFLPIAPLRSPWPWVSFSLLFQLQVKRAVVDWRQERREKVLTKICVSWEELLLLEVIKRRVPSYRQIMSTHSVELNPTLSTPSKILK